MVYIVLLLLPLISAEESFIFPRDYNASLEIPIFQNDISRCTTCSCLISINYPNGSNAVRDAPTTITTNHAIFKLNKTTTQVLGAYKVDLHCNNSADYGSATFEYLVTPNGFQLLTSEGIIYFLLLGVLIFIFLLTLYFGLAIPYSNKRDEMENLVSINDLKYLKVFLLFIAYFLLIWIVATMRFITENLLFKTELHKVFAWLFWILWAILIPIMSLSFIFLVVAYLQDKKIRKALERGVPFR